MDLANYRLHVDWEDTGTFAGAYDDVSAYLMTWDWTNGNDTGQIGAKAGSFNAKLDNSSSIFSSFNAASPIYGKIIPGIKVRFQMQIGAGSWVTMWQGDLDRILPTVGLPVTISTASLQAYGSLQSFSSETNVDVAMMEDATTGAAVGAVLDAADFPAGDRAIDTGQSTMSRFWAKQGKTIDLLRQLEATEVGLLRETKDGKIAFEDRAHRAGAPHNTPRSTYGSGTLFLWDLQQQDPIQDIYNHIEVNVRTFNISDSVVLVNVVDARNGLGGAPIPFANGETKVIVIDFPAPSTPAQFLAVYDWGICDLEVNTQENLLGTDISNDIALSRTETGRRLTVTMTNNSGSAGYIVVMKVHGIAIIESDPILIQDDDETSPVKYKKSFPNPSQWITHEQEARDYCTHVLAMYGGMRRALRFTLKANYDATHLLEAQTIDVSDRIHVTAPVGTFGLGIDEDFFVEWVRHSVNEGRIHTVQVYCRQIVSHTWGASGTPYTPKTIPSSSSTVPDDLHIVGWPMGLQVNTGCWAWKYNANIDQAEFRAKRVDLGSLDNVADLRTPEEGGTMVHDGTDNLIITGMAANFNGINYGWTSASAGIWFITYRFHNPSGWSVWSDGNPTPEKVKNKFSTDTDYDAGPPADWTVWLDQGAPGWVIPKASRPNTNGNRIIFIGWQIRDIHDAAAEEAWQNLDDNSDPSEVHYNGSAVDHKYDADTYRIMRSDESGGGFGTAAAGDLIMVDMRADNFQRDYTVFMQINGVADTYIQLGGPTLFNTGVVTDMRIKIVRCPWSWDTKGYLGLSPGQGWAQSEYWNVPNADGTTGDTTTQIFSGPAMPIPAGLDFEDLVLRAFIQNGYARSDGGEYSTPAEVGSGGSTGYEVILTDAATIVSDARLADTIPRKVYFVQLLDSVGPTRELGNPTGAKHRQPMAYILRQSATGNLAITLGSKFRTTKMVPVGSNMNANHQDYYGIMYDAYDDRFDVVSFVPDYGD